jgi:hypothetical protein
VTVVNRNGGWLLVQATLKGKQWEGYVSQELVEFVSAAFPASTKKLSQTAPKTKRRLFFAIYYRVPDNAFRRAANTWERETRQAFQFDDKVDLFLSIEVRFEAEFKAAWNRIHSESMSKLATVIQGQIFSHSSKSRGQGGERNGLEFDGNDNDASQDGTLMRAELGSLAPLNWDPQQGYLILSGCNSGVTGTRNWAPAQVLARSQNVRTTGQTGYAYFSTSPNRYVEINNNSTTVYLWAYRRGQNGFLGDGDRMEGMTFTP